MAIKQQHPPMAAPMKPKGSANVMPEKGPAPPKKSSSAPAKPKAFRDQKF